MGEHVDTRDQRYHYASREEEIKFSVSYFGPWPLSRRKNNQRRGPSCDYEVNDRGIEHPSKDHVTERLQRSHVSGFAVGKVMWMSGNIQEKTDVADDPVPADRNEREYAKSSGADGEAPYDAPPSAYKKNEGERNCELKLE